MNLVSVHNFLVNLVLLKGLQIVLYILDLPCIILFQDVEEDEFQFAFQTFFLPNHCIYLLLKALFIAVEFDSAQWAFFLILIDNVYLSTFVTEFVLNFQTITEQGSIIEGDFSIQIQHDKSSSGYIADGVSFFSSYYYIFF